MACGWANVKKPEAVNLKEIMSEEARENRKLDQKIPITDAHTSSNATLTSEDIPDEVLRAISNDTMDSDALVATMLQLQFDKEYDKMLMRTQQKYNGDSKVSISFKKFKRTPENFDFESDKEENTRGRKEWNHFDSFLSDKSSFPVCGYKKFAKSSKRRF